MFSGEHAGSWAVLLNKGYPGVLEIFCGIAPKKKPAHGTLAILYEAFNIKVSSDRIIVENYFGHLRGKC